MCAFLLWAFIQVKVVHVVIFYAIRCDNRDLSDSGFRDIGQIPEGVSSELVGEVEVEVGKTDPQSANHIGCTHHLLGLFTVRIGRVELMGGLGGSESIFVIVSMLTWLMSDGSNSCILVVVYTNAWKQR